MKEEVEEYNKALALNPYEKYLHNNLGMIYKKWGMMDKAREEFRKEIEVNPSTRLAYGNLQRLDFESNFPEKALPDMQAPNN